MSGDVPPTRPEGPRFPLLERLTATVLLLVVLALGGLLLAAYRPEWVGAASEAQVIVLLALLLTALLLVSLVALLHTRG